MKARRDWLILSLGRYKLQSKAMNGMGLTEVDQMAQNLCWVEQAMERLSRGS